MGLSDDQRAMLRLLAQRGEQGYEDIAALKGLSVDQVRAQVAAALAQLDEEGALAPSAPAAAAAEPEPPAAAAEPEPPRTAPASPPTPSPPKAKKPRPTKRTPKLSLPSGSGLRAAIAAGIAVVALIAIVLIVSGGGDDESTVGTATTAASSTGSNQNAANDASSNPNGVTKAVLKAVDGSAAEGVAIFGKLDQGKKESLALDVAIEGLAPSGSGSSYTIWLSQSPQKMLPLVSTPVNKTGKVAGQFEVPVEVLAYLANETFKDLVVTKTTDSTLEAALKKATAEKEAPAYTGTEILRGTVVGPVVGAQIRQEELEKAKEEAE